MVVAVAVGYVVLLASPGYLVHHWIAVLVPVTMLSSLVGTLFVFPSHSGCCGRASRRTSICFPTGTRPRPNCCRWWCRLRIGAEAKLLAEKGATC